MARRKAIFAPGCYYHIYNHGVNRKPIFRNQDNYLFLLHRIKEYASKFHIAVIAYCLMPNHYHMLLRQDREYPVSTFIQAIFNSYTKAFNKAFGRRGTLFEGPFDAVYIDHNSCLVHLCRYIHRNPVQAGLVQNPAEWPFSNYLEWIEKRAGSLVDRSFVKIHFPTSGEYERFVMEYKASNEVEPILHELNLE